MVLPELTYITTYIVQESIESMERERGKGGRKKGGKRKTDGQREGRERERKREGAVGIMQMHRTKGRHLFILVGKLV